MNKKIQAHLSFGNQLANLIDEYAIYCQNKYQPRDLPHLTLDEALIFQDRMTQSLTGFGIWLGTVKKEMEQL